MFGSHQPVDKGHRRFPIGDMSDISGGARRPKGRAAQYDEGTRMKVRQSLRVSPGRHGVPPLPEHTRWRRVHNDDRGMLGKRTMTLLIQQARL